VGGGGDNGGRKKERKWEGKSKRIKEKENRRVKK
jgi:hypothetical protein